MRLIDARGLPCPKPVLLAKEALEESPEGAVVRVLVDNVAARDNILRLAKNYSADAEVVTESDELFNIEIVLPQSALPKRTRTSDEISRETSVCASQKTAVKLAILITSDTLGRPEEQLGAVLIGSFLDTLPSVRQRPNTIILMNAGVKLACEGSPHIEKLKRLADGGVEILVCGTCLDYFSIKDKRLVGTVSNMFSLAEILTSSDKTICL